MKFADFICFDALIADLRSDDREGVIRELVQALSDAGQIPGHLVDTLVKGILAREKNATTGWGKGIAIPHVKHEDVPKLVGTIGRSSLGVDFASHDRAPVYLVFLLVSPPSAADRHLKAMERIAFQSHVDQFRSFLRQSESPQEMADLLREADAQS